MKHDGNSPLSSIGRRLSLKKEYLFGSNKANYNDSLMKVWISIFG